MYHKINIFITNMYASRTLINLADMVISYLQQENKANNYEVSDARVQLVEPNLKHIV